MKFAIVSDTHNNWANFKKIIEWLNKENIQLILHCGDIASREIIEEARKLFKGQMRFVKGNADYDLSSIPEKDELLLGDKKIAFAHFPDIAKKLSQSGKYDLVFYGHTHRVWEEAVGKCRVVNPGEAAGQFYKPTFAVYDTDTGELELKILEKI